MRSQLISRLLTWWLYRICDLLFSLYTLEPAVDALLSLGNIKLLWQTVRLCLWKLFSSFSTAYTKCLFLTVYKIPGNPGILRRRVLWVFFPVPSSPSSCQVAAGAGTQACSVGKAATSWGPSAQHPALPRGQGDSSPGDLKDSQPPQRLGKDSGLRRELFGSIRKGDKLSAPFILPVLLKQLEKGLLREFILSNS